MKVYCVVLVSLFYDASSRGHIAPDTSTHLNEICLYLIKQIRIIFSPLYVRSGLHQSTIKIPLTYCRTGINHQAVWGWGLSERQKAAVLHVEEKENRTEKISVLCNLQFTLSTHVNRFYTKKIS